jgi:hypothetical protein
VNNRLSWIAAACGLAALLLLLGIYRVVADATHSAHSARQHSVDQGARQAVCSMRSAASRELCLSTLAVPTGGGGSEIGNNRVAQTPSSSTSNIKVAFGGIAPPAPRAP